MPKRRTLWTLALIGMAVALGCGPTWVSRTDTMDGRALELPGTRSELYRAAVRVLFRNDLGIQNRDEGAGTVETEEIALSMDGTADKIYFRIRILVDDGSVAVRLTKCEKGIRGFATAPCKEGQVPSELAAMYETVVRELREEAFTTPRPESAGRSRLSDTLERLSA